MPNAQICVLLASASMFGLAAPAAAQDIPAGPTDTAAQATTRDLAGVEDIVVTAQRRSENIQDVPISITAVTAGRLEAQGISNTDSLGQITPGLTLTRYAQATQPWIRGIGTQSLNVGQEGAVATYVDGVYIGDSYALPFSFNNIERLEVLKGPQGTLFGRNATGGLINIITRMPQAELTVKGMASYGNYDTATGALYVSGGSDTIAADLALYGIHQGDGFGRYLLTGKDVSFQREGGIRSRIAINFSPDDMLILSGDYYEIDSDIGGVRNPVPGSFTLGGIPSTGGWYDTASDQPAVLGNNYSWGAGAQYKRNMGDTNLTVISAYRRSARDQLIDNEGTSAPISTSRLDTLMTSFQNEIYLSGTSGAFNWTTGIFIWNSKAIFNLPVRSGTIPAGNIYRFADQRTESYAAYGQGTYAISDATNVTVGLRYTIDQRHLTGFFRSLPGNPVPAGTILATFQPDDTKDSRLTWRLALDHHFTDSLMAYLSYNRGFKSGTFNTTNAGAPPVNPETIDAYEAGFKADFLENQLRFNLAAFYYNYKDIQLTTVGQGIVSLFNAATARVYGLEPTVEIAPTLDTGHLSIRAGLSLLLDATYTDFPSGPVNTPRPPAAGGNVTTFADLAGNRMIRSPKWTLNSDITYTVPVADNELSFNLSYYHNSGFFWEPDNRLRQDAYDIFNGSIYYSFGSANQYRVGLYGKNLTDAKYDLYTVEGALGDYHTAGYPRTYGVSFQFEF